MPTFPPRSEPTKKKEELESRKQVLEDSIRNHLEFDQISKNAEQYRDARLLYYKAVLHVIREKEWKEKRHSYNKEKILQELENWKVKQIDEIIEEVKRNL